MALPSVFRHVRAFTDVYGGCPWVVQEDPIDQAVLNSFHDHFKEEATRIQQSYTVEQFAGFNPIVKRTVARVVHNGNKMMISKGLLNKVLDTRSTPLPDNPPPLPRYLFLSLSQNSMRAT